MPDAAPDLKAVIDAGVGANKPSFAEVFPERLARFLETMPDVSGPVKILDVSGGGDKAGASSGIVVFTVDLGGEANRLVFRYAPATSERRLFAEYDIAGQFHFQAALHRAGLPVARPRWLDADGGGAGMPGFIMDHVEGEVADGSAFTGGLIADASPERRERLITGIFGALDQIHSVDWRKYDLGRHVRDGGGRHPVEGYLNWFWKTAEWVDPPELERLRKVRDWLVANAPDHHPDDFTLVHGDPGLGNYMFRDERIVSILDWELAGIVHPDMDIAMQCSLNDFFRASAPADVAATIPSTEAWTTHYEGVTGRTLTHFDYYRQFVALPSLIVSLSMNRNMPAEMKAAHAGMLEPLWQIAEAR